MSKYECYETTLCDREALIAALCENGFQRDQILVHEKPVALEGYEGRKRSEQAEIVIPRRHVGPGANDIGFAFRDGRYEAYVSDYDRRRFGDTWLRNVQADHDKHRVLSALARRGYRNVKVETTEQAGLKHHRIVAQVPKRQAQAGLKS